jgi:signal recognition particle GTPase
MLLEEILAYDSIEIKNSTCSQLFPCLCQKGINPEIIKYIINEFKEKCESEDIFDEEIAKALLNITFFMLLIYMGNSTIIN